LGPKLGKPVRKLRRANGDKEMRHLNAVPLE
jgi:hypothetical protein